MTRLRGVSNILLSAALACFASALWTCGPCRAEDAKDQEHTGAHPAGEHADKGHADKGHADKGHADKGHADKGHADKGHDDKSHGEEAGHGDGLPGLNPVEGPHGGFRADLPLWSAITFGIFFLILAKFAWAPLRDGLDAREAKIRQDIASAESNRLKAESLLRDYETKLAKSQDEVKEILAEARRDAETAKQDMIATAEKEAAALRQRAVADIDRARDNALGELFDFVSKNVMQATEQVVGRSLTGADQDRLVKEALANLDLRKN